MGDVEKASPSDSSTTDTEDTVANIPLETPSSAVPSNPPPPPSKWTAWAQILAGHLMVFNTFGYIGSWGLFQAYYIEALNSSSSNIAWVGSLQLFLVFAIGTLSGRALDAGFLRFTIASGCALQIIAIFTTSVVGSYWQLFLAQGVCQGIGNGLTFTPMISLVSTYYSDKYRALAVSFVAAGAATGGMVFPSIARQLLQSVGVGWTLRVMGFVFITNSVVTLALIKPRVAARKSGPLFEFVAFKEVPFLLYTVGTFLALWGLYFAYYYVSIFSTTIIHVPSQQSFYFIMAINAIGIPGRILPAWLVPRCGGVLNVYIPCVFMAGVLLYLWSLVSTDQGLIAWIVFYGFFANAVQSLFVGGVGSLTKDPRKMGARIGMVFSAISIACLTGPPIAGALIDRRDGGFLYAQIFGGTVMVSGSVALVGTLLTKDK